jgi:hypothetical protein
MAGSKSIATTMKIKLIRTGGFIPVTKAAETEVDLTEKEIVRLLDALQPDPSAPLIKDGNYYELRVGIKSSPVDLQKVPEEYRELFNKLRSELKFIK